MDSLNTRRVAAEGTEATRPKESESESTTPTSFLTSEEQSIRYTAIMDRMEQHDQTRMANGWRGEKAGKLREMAEKRFFDLHDVNGHDPETLRRNVNSLLNKMENDLGMDV